MIRMEIIANSSVQDDIIDGLESTIPAILYTLFPIVYGRGKNNRKLESTTWPETNFMLISYMDEKMYNTAATVIEGIKAKFPDEGIKIFCIPFEQEKKKVKKEKLEP